MKIRFNRGFKKQYKKLSKKERDRVDGAIRLFSRDPFHLVLNNHSLRGDYFGFRSINIGGDLRAIYKLISDDVAYFTAVGRHSELYS